MKNKSLFVVVLVTFILDRFFKYLSLHLPGDGFFCCYDKLGIQAINNPGIAFGLPFPQILTILLALIIIVSIVYIIIYKENSYLNLIGLSLILSGAISNLFDRLQYGHVLDYIYIKPLPVFNLADFFITVGIIIIIRSELNKYKKSLNNT